MKYIYLIKTGENNYKVGMAFNYRDRIASLQTSNPEKIETVAVKLVDDAAEIEATIHQYLNEHRMDGGREWFRLEPEHVIRLLILLNKYPDVEGLHQKLILLDMKKTYDFELKKLNRNIETVLNGYTKLKEKAEKAIEPKAIQTMDDATEIAWNIIQEHGKASASLLQRKMTIGYAKAARIIEALQRDKKLGSLIGQVQGYEIIGPVIIESNVNKEF